MLQVSMVEAIIFILLYTIVIALVCLGCYYVGRNSRTEDIDYLTDQILSGVSVDKAPSKHRMSRVRYNPGNFLDPVEPEGEPYKRRGKEGA